VAATDDGVFCEVPDAVEVVVLSGAVDAAGRLDDDGPPCGVAEPDPMADPSAPTVRLMAPTVSGMRLLTGDTSAAAPEVTPETAPEIALESAGTTPMTGPVDPDPPESRPVPNGA